MKNHVLKALCAALLITSMAVPASAQPVPGKPAASPSTLVLLETNNDESVAVTVTDGVMGYTAEEEDTGAAEETPDETPEEEKKDKEKEEDRTTVSRVGYYPFQVQYEEQNGTPIVIKSFRVPTGVDPSSLIEDEWEEDGYRYSQYEILMDEPELVVEEKTVAEPITFTTEKNDPEEVRAAIDPILEYNKNGYTGQLTLDYSSISTTETDTETYAYPIKKTVEVNNLSDNDYAFLDKELNGLTLQGAEWKLENGVPRADDIIPGSYTAYATYTGTGYGTRPTGYTHTAYYTGTVKRVTDGDMVCSIVYRGDGMFPWTGFFAGLALLALAAAGAVMVMRGIIVIPALVARQNRRKDDDSKPPVEIP